MADIAIYRIIGEYQPNFIGKICDLIDFRWKFLKKLQFYQICDEILPQIGAISQVKSSSYKGHHRNKRSRMDID